MIVSHRQPITGTGKRRHKRRPEGRGAPSCVRREWLDESHRAERRYGRALVRAALDGTDVPRVAPVRKAADWWGTW